MVQADFVKSAISDEDFPREKIPEVVFAGRSNVGKSSLINALAGSKKLARTSATPGKTQYINFYRINQAFFFVDLPGFGYAKAGKSAILRWKGLIERYFRKRSAIALVIHLVDSRIPPTKMDIQLADWLEKLALPCMLVATKSDKLSNNQKGLQARMLSDFLGKQTILMSSAKTGAGCKEIWERVLQATAVIRSS